MFDGWKRAAVLALIVLALAVYTLLRQAPQKTEIERLEARLTDYPIETGGEAARPVGDRARYYANVRPRSYDDLPFFTTLPERPQFLGKPVVVGVLVLPGLWETRPVGAHRVAPRDMPRFVHGGCRVVNVVYDPRGDEILGAWCNLGQPRPNSKG